MNFYVLAFIEGNVKNSKNFVPKYLNEVFNNIIIYLSLNG